VKVLAQPEKVRCCDAHAVGLFAFGETLEQQFGAPLRLTYSAKGPRGRRIPVQVISSVTSCPIPEIARLGGTQWRPQVLAHFTTGGVSNGGTDGINLLIERTRRLAHGFRKFDNYRLRILLVADGTTMPTTAYPGNDEEPH
jgi:hypothetical protein